MKTYPEVKISLDVDSVINYMDLSKMRFEDNKKFFSETNDYMEIEHHQVGSNSSMMNIYSFLEVDTDFVGVSSTIKQSTRPLREYIKNIDEIEEYILKNNIQCTMK